ncbi:YqcC family protein [Pseudoalteromonas sp.]|uniref:YqcC family protein n=1 Tax=Pseudoalteromonas sp. TaxID=53249 RepID=UPI003565E37C
MYQQTQHYLVQLTALLKKHQLWQSEPIAPAALQSSVPFCHDTMAFEQWLQFVFIEKFQQLITQQQPLPRNFAIAPMAQMVLSSKTGSDEIIALLSELDAFLGEPNG